MAIIGEAILNIKPQVVGGLANYINNELGAANSSFGTAGEKAGTTFIGRFKQTASFMAWSTVASGAINVVGDSLGKAASRVDTLNNYPRVMQNLGIDAEEANRSISTMSDDLQNVPTRLDDMARSVQGIFAATDKYGTSLDTATDAGLALNNMLLAGGQSTGIVNSAMEQFRQMVAKGKPDLQDWRSLLSAAPGQMKQLAEEMLGAGASADDLYKALGGGQPGQAGIDFTPEIDMKTFIEKLAGMKDKFAEAAQDAQGGIQTSLANMQNAVTRGIAKVFEGIGQENIASAINDVKGGISAVFSSFGDVAQNLTPVLGGIWDTLKGVLGGIGEGVKSVMDAIGPLASAVLPALSAAAAPLGSLLQAVAPLAGAFIAVKAPMALVGDLARALGPSVANLGTNVFGLYSKFASTTAQTGSFAQGLGSLVAGFNPLPAIVGAAAVAIGAYVAKQMEAEQFSNDFSDSVRGIGKIAESADKALQIGARSVEDYGGAHARALPDIRGLYDSIQEYTDKIGSIQSGAEESIGLLGQYKTVVDQLAGAGSASAGDLAKLEWALDGIEQATGRAYDAQEVLKGSYEDEAGEVHYLKDEIDKLIESKQQEARADALKEMYTETWKMQAEAARELSRAEEEYYTSHEIWMQAHAGSAVDAAAAEEKFAESRRDVVDNLNQAQSAYDSLTTELNELEQMMALNTQATDGASNSVADWISQNQLASATLQDLTPDLVDFAARLTDAGISTEDLANYGDENFMRLANRVHGDVDAMVSEITRFNDTPIVNKDGTINIDDQRLRDAQNNVYTFNKDGKPEDKDGKVAVNDTELTDAFGNVVKWNGEKLEPKDTKITVDGTQALQGAIDTHHDFQRLPDFLSKEVTFTTNNVTNNIINDIHNSSSHAAGGHVEPRHASGAIVAGPTRTPFGLVGENGVEAVIRNDDGSTDVYPLNNPRYLGYARPLAQAIAAWMSRAGAEAKTVVNVNLNYDAGAEPNEMAYGIADKLALVLGARGM